MKIFKLYQTAEYLWSNINLWHLITLQAQFYHCQVLENQCHFLAMKIRKQMTEAGCPYKCNSGCAHQRKFSHQK